MMRALVVTLWMAASAMPASAQGTLMTAEEALVMAKELEEVKALYGVQGGRWAECIESKVDRSCDSGWVTCIDDGWVVTFVFGGACGIAHDGRLSVTLLIDAKSQRVISRFPEKEYFSAPAFCHDSHDCLPIKDGERLDGTCQNFIFAQLGGVAGEGTCQCIENTCEPHP